MAEFNNKIMLRTSQATLNIQSWRYKYYENDPYYISIDFTLRGKKRNQTFGEMKNEIIPEEIRYLFADGVPLINITNDGAKVEYIIKIFFAKDETERDQLIDRAADVVRNAGNNGYGYYHDRYIFDIREHPERLPFIYLEPGENPIIKVNAEVGILSDCFVRLVYNCIEKL